MTNRIGAYLTRAGGDENIDRALDTLNFCGTMLRIHHQAGEVRESEVCGLRLLELWARGVLRAAGRPD